MIWSIVNVCCREMGEMTSELGSAPVKEMELTVEGGHCDYVVLFVKGDEIE